MTKAEAQQRWDDFDSAEREVLLQLRTVTWDGNLASKLGRSMLVTKGYASRYEGFNVISHSGMILLEALGKLPTT
jgi:hypothetical protein